MKELGGIVTDPQEHRCARMKELNNYNNFHFNIQIISGIGHLYYLREDMGYSESEVIEFCPWCGDKFG